MKLLSVIVFLILPIQVSFTQSNDILEVDKNRITIGLGTVKELNNGKTDFLFSASYMANFEKYFFTDLGVDVFRTTEDGVKTFNYSVNGILIRGLGFFKNRFEVFPGLGATARGSESSEVNTIMLGFIWALGFQYNISNKIGVKAVFKSPHYIYGGKLSLPFLLFSTGIVFQ